MVPRFSSRIGTPPVGACWKDTRLEWQASASFTDVLTGAHHAFEDSIPLSLALGALPVAVLISSTPA
jgi:maltooligosyltrehalose synthase